MATNDGGFIGQDGLNAPDSPTGVSATAGDTEATISFTAPSDVGGSAITGYSVQSDNGDGTYFYSYSVENAAYASKSLDVSSQDIVPSGIAFNSDGTKAFIAGDTNDAIYQFSLSTAYDISTATYDSVSFSVSSQGSARDLCFKPDGTKMLVISSSNDTIFQYSLSTGFDLSTASYDSVSLSITSKDTNPQAVQFNDDGTSLYFVGTQNDTVHQYDMSSAYDLSTASDASKSFSVTNEETAPQGLFFKPDGTKFYIAGVTSDAVFQYSLSTAFDMSTASYDGISFDVSSEATAPMAVIFNGDGSSMYIVDNTTDSIYQYTTGFDTYPTSSPVTVTGLTNGTSYTFNVWAINAFGWSSPSDASGSVTPSVFAAPTAYFFGGNNGGYKNVIQYVAFATLGNTTDFGDLLSILSRMGACSSSTRGVVAGGINGGTTNVIQYVTLTSTGNASDFGDLLAINRFTSSCSSDTRGCTGGGQSGTGTTYNTIQYVTIASTGDATDFGDLTSSRWGTGACGSTTRGIFAAGYDPRNTIDYITIASTGNATDFGDLTVNSYAPGGLSNSTRGVFGGGDRTNVIDYITIASTGNATDFGDLLGTGMPGAAASSTRGLFFGGSSSDTKVAYITIASTGNATEFGDLLAAGGRDHGAACSNAHGGLS